MTKSKLAFLAFGALIFFSVGTAQAQKQKDTLRFALHQPIKLVDAIFNPHPESNLMDSMVMDPLLQYDSEARKLVPHLVESWNMVDDRTVELKLRQDVTFHDGSTFDADDVVYTFNFVTDPKVNFRFKDTRFGWFDSVEKTGKYTVRVRSQEVIATMLTRLTSTPPMLPSDAHAALEDKSQFGRAPVGTGPYKAAQIDSTKGVVLVANDGYKLASAAKPAAKIGRIQIGAIADAQTQMAELMVGNLDFVFHLDYDQAKNLAQSNPDLELLVVPTVSFTYILFDSADRTGIGHFKDQRVREALLHAIDRKALRQAVVPKQLHGEPFQQAMCHPWHIGCVSSAEPPSYDPDKAKALLKAAGLENGFDLKLLTWGQSDPVAEAVAGQLRAVGVNASVDAGTVGVFVKKRAQNQAQTMVSLWDNGHGQPDVDTTTGFFFLPGSRNYTGDDQLSQWVLKGRRTLDLEKRKEIYRKLFDRVTEQRYAMPLVELPAVLAHSSAIEISTKHKKPEGFELNRISWSK